MGRTAAHLDTNTPGFCRVPYFSQTLEDDVEEREFSKSSTLLKYLDDLLLYTPFSNLFTGDSIYLLKFVALKGYKVSKVGKKKQCVQI